MKGSETESISVDRSRDPYLFLRQLIYNKQVILPKNEYFKTECERLGDDIYNIDSVRYEQLNSKLYAIFTCTFQADNGAEYCESVGFSRELQDSL